MINLQNNSGLKRIKQIDFLIFCSNEFKTKIDAETGREITFGEMSEQSIRCALWLRSQGVGKNDVVSVCSYSSLDSYVPILAAFYEGAIYNTFVHEIAVGE